jgi:hypothetical protein
LALPTTLQAKSYFSFLLKTKPPSQSFGSQHYQLSFFVGITRFNKCTFSPRTFYQRSDEKRQIIPDLF